MSYLVKASNPVANTRAAQSMRAVFAAGSRGGDRVVKVTDLSQYKRTCSERPVLERGREFDSRPPHILLRPTEAATLAGEPGPTLLAPARPRALAMYVVGASDKATEAPLGALMRTSWRPKRRLPSSCVQAPPLYRPRGQGLRTPPLVLLTTPHPETTMQALKLARKYPNFSQEQMMQLVEQFK